MFGTISLGCLKLEMPTYLAYILISSLVPLIIMSAIWALYTVRVRLAENEFNRRKCDKIKQEHIGYALMVAYLVLPTVAQVQFKG